MSDGEPSYQTLFPEVFGVPYRPARSRQRGRFPKLRYEMPRSGYRIARPQAHVQIVKQRLGKRLVKVDSRLVHGSHKRLERELRRRGYQDAQHQCY